MMGRLNKRLINMSVRRKLIYSLIFLLFVPSFITFFISITRTNHEVENEAVKNAAETLNASQLYINNVIQQMIYISSYIYLDDDIKTAVNMSSNHIRLNPDPSATYQMLMDNVNVSKKLGNLAVSRDSIYINILLKNGTSFTSYQPGDFKPLDIFKKTWFKRAEPIVDSMNDLSVTWVAPHPTYMSNNKNDYMISLIRAMQYPGTYIVISIEESQIRAILQKYAKTQQMVLVNSEGNVISSVDPKEIGKPFPEFNLVKGESDVRRKMAVDGKQQLLASKSIMNGQWYIVSLIPYQQTVKKFSSMYRRDLIVQLSFLTIFLMIMVTMITRITRPLILLDRTVRKVERGDLQVRASPIGEGEAGRLGRSINFMLDRIQEMIEQIKEEQQTKRSIELEMLQAQINPHFLFNVLNSIRMRLMVKGDNEHAKMIHSLSTLLSMTITRNNEFITLEQEIEVVRHYVNLMNMRHKYPSDLRIDCPEDCKTQEVPRFFLQPLIENALIHGLEGGEISIAIKKDREFLLISIRDNGKGMDEDTLGKVRSTMQSAKDRQKEDEKQLSGIGIFNVYERLRIIYGESADITVHSTLGIGTEFIIQIPLDKEGD